MRLPIELRLQILTEVLFDFDEIPFNFNSPRTSVLLLEALKRHAVQLPSSYWRSYSAWSLEAILSLRLAPQWKDQTFVNIEQHDPGYPNKLSNARALYYLAHRKSVPYRSACSECRDKIIHSCPNRANSQILRVCKGLYYIALPLLYSLNIFSFENAYELGAVLHAVGPGRAFIRYVDVRSQLFHGGVLWEYLLPCRTIRQVYFPESFQYVMKQDGQRVYFNADHAPDFFSGWLIRGGHAFFDMVREREVGRNDPLGILLWHGGCKDVELNRAAGRALRARLPLKVDKEKRASPPTPNPTTTVSHPMSGV